MLESCLSKKILLKQKKFLLVFLGIFVIFSSYHVKAQNDNALLVDLVSEMPKTKLKNMPSLVEELEAVQDERLLLIFESMLDGNLFYLKSNKKVVSIRGDKDGIYTVEDVISNEIVSDLTKSQLKKIKVNNRLRKQLRKAIAKLTLFSPNVALRKNAVENLISDLSPDNIELIEEAQAIEKNNSVLKKMDLALNIAKLDSNDNDQIKLAINQLSGNLHPAVKNRLESILEKDEEGKYLEQDKELIQLSEKSLSSIEGQLKFYGFLERLFFGLSLGSVLLLAAIGLAITFGVMGVINMAHGELLMLGAYTVYVIQQLMPNHIGLSIFVSIPVAFIFCGLVGMAIERGVIQFLKGRPLETLLATFGISLILQQTVRSIFSPLNRQVSTPDWMSGTWEINSAFGLTYNRLYIILFSLIVFAILLLVMKRTALGLYVRAVSQNRNMAKAVGIRSEWVDAMTFGLGSGVAGVAGVALSQLTNVGPNLGQSYIIDSFMVVVFGGVGNLWGTLVGAFSLGVVSKFMEPVTGTVLAQIFVLIFIVLFIQKRPKGLFPQRGRAAEE